MPLVFLFPSKSFFSFNSYSRLRKFVDAEMKDAQKSGIDNKKAQKERVTDEEEKQMWDQGYLGNDSAKKLLNTVYFYNGKLFGIRSSEHRLLRLCNIEIGDNCIHFRERVSKTFHGGVEDLKRKSRDIRHLCHNEYNRDHEPCLVKIYNQYFALVKNLNPAVREGAFYFQPFYNKLGFKNCVVGINSLNKMLPDLCKGIGCPRKTSHSLRVTCASSLFNNNVEEKLIRERTGHLSNALFRYEQPSKEKQEQVSNILGPVVASNKEAKKETDIKLDNNEIKEENFPNFDLADEFWDEFANFDFQQAARPPPQPQSRGINISGNCNVTVHNYLNVEN